MGRSMVLIKRDDGGADNKEDKPTKRGCRIGIDIEKASTTLEGVFEIHSAKTADDNTSLMVVVVSYCYCYCYCYRYCITLLLYSFFDVM